MATLSDFPILANGSQQQQKWLSVDIPTPKSLLSSSQVVESSAGFEALFAAAWALTLSQYTGSTQATFAIARLIEGAFPPNDVRRCSLDVNAFKSWEEVIGNIQGTLRKESVEDDANAAVETCIIFPKLQKCLNGIDNDLMEEWMTGCFKESSNAAIALLVSRRNDDDNPITSPSLSTASLHWQPSMMSETQARCVAATASKAVDELLLRGDVGPPHTFNLLTDRDLDLMRAWTNTTSRTHRVKLAPSQHTITAAFTWRARQQPSACAINAWDGDLTYAELDQLSTDIAHQLSLLGVAVGTNVAVCFDKSKWATVGLLAALKGGATITPLDPAHPTNFRKRILTAADASIVLTTDSQVACVPERSGLLVVPLSSLLSNQPRPVPLPLVEPSDGAFILHTSGSSGHPKSVRIDHSSFVAGALTRAATLPLTPSSRVPQLASFTFVMSLSALFATLLHGGCVCQPSAAAVSDDLAGYMRAAGVDTFIGVPSVAATIEPAAVPGLERLAMGGEVPSEAVLAKWAGRVRLFNFYGSTETGPNLVARTFAGPRKGLLAPVGPNIALVGDVEDPGRLVPVGAVGELLVGGPNIACGYRNRETGDEDPFVTDCAWMEPLGIEPGTRFFRTGDLARQHVDGSVEVIGRKARALKIRGQKVHVGQVVHWLERHPDVKRAVVLSPEKGTCQGRLVAVLELGYGEEHDAAAGAGLMLVCDTAVSSQIASVSDLMAANLPAYMVPDLFVVVTRIPLTLTGKADFQRVSSFCVAMSADMLKEVKALQDGNSVATGHAVPLTRLERRLLSIWASTLGADEDEICLDSSFVTLGGDSLSATQVVASAREEGIEIATADLLRLQTIRDLAKIARVDSELSQLQSGHDVQRLRDRIASAPKRAVALKTAARLEPRKVRAAVEAVVGSHPVLMACCLHDDGIGSTYQLRFHEGKSTDQDHVGSLLGNLAEEKMDGPAMRVDVVEMADTTILLVAVSAAVANGSCLAAVVCQLQQNLSAGITQPSKGWRRRSVAHESRQAADRKPPVHLEDGRASFEETFRLPQETTSGLLGSWNTAFRTEPADLLLAAMHHSLAQCFAEPEARPIIFTDVPPPRQTGTGRAELLPLLVPRRAAASLLEDLIDVKDSRRLQSEASEVSTSQDHLSAICSYLDLQWALREDAPILPCHLGDVGPELWNPLSGHPIHMSAAVGEDRRLHIRLHFSRIAPHLLKPLKKWAHRFRQTIEALQELLTSHATRPVFTKGDFPAWNPTEVELERINDAESAVSKIAATNDIETIFPCSPMQEGLLISRLKGSGSLYKLSCLMELEPVSPGIALDPVRLEAAWQRVIDHHQALRSVIVESCGEERMFDQVVLRTATPRVTRLRFPNYAAVHQHFQKVLLEPLGDQNDLPHRMTLCITSDSRTFALLEQDHTTTDALSLALTRRDLVAAYSGPLRSAAPRTSYQDFIAHIIRQQHSPLRPTTCSIDALEPCHFPTLQPTSAALPAADQAAAAPHTTRVRFADGAALRAFCARTGFTPATVLQGAWAAVLARYTSQACVCFGVLSSGRDAPVPGIQDAVGALIGMVVCAVDAAPGRALGAILDEMREAQLRGVEAQWAPLAEVQKRAGVAAGEGLFNSIMSVYKPLRAEGREVRAVVRESVDRVEYAISVIVEDRGEEVRIGLKCDLERVSASMAAGAAATFASVLEEICGSEELDRALSTRPSAEDLHQIFEWNGYAVRRTEDCVHRFIEREAAARPDAPALDAWDGALTYGQLDKHADRAASFLSSIGVRSRALVPVCFEKSVWAPVAMVAILKAGAAFVPLDPSHPPARLSTMLKSTSASMVVASPSCAEQLADVFAGLRVVSLDAALLSSLPPPSSIRPRDVSPSIPAYCIFTSGSTGAPKGVLVPHSAYCTGFTGHSQGISLSRSSRVLQFASYAFDTSIEDHLSTLMAGACLCIPCEDDRSDSQSLAAFARAHQVNWAHLTPSFASTLEPSAFPTLATLALGGEPMTAVHVARWAGRLQLLNVYGPSECCVTSTVNASIRAHIPSSARSIGTALPGAARTWLVSPTDVHRLVPIGAVGELLVEGPIVAQGYLGDAAATAAAFLEGDEAAPAWTRLGPVPQGDDMAPRRFYRTGDMARYRAERDGALEFGGRMDAQVKLRGQRLELGEVEHHLATAAAAEPITGQSVVLLPTAGALSKRLVAVMAVGDAAALDLDDAAFAAVGEAGSLRVCTAPSKKATMRLASVQARLETSLPAYMVPTLYVLALALPQNVSRKADRRAIQSFLEQLSPPTARLLSHVFSTSSPEGEDGSAGRPRDELEAQLQSIWCDVLALPAEDVGVHASFVALGGDSISAMAVVARCRAAGVAASSRSVLQSRTIAQLAATVREAVQGRSALTTVLPTPGSAAEAGRFPLSPVQMLHFRLATDGDNLDQQAFLLRLSSKVAVEDLETAFEAMVEAHPALRMRFELSTDSARWAPRLAGGKARDALSVVERHIAAEEELEQTIATAERRIDFRRGPLLSAALVNKKHGEQLLFLAIHHLVVDLVSGRVILRELEDFLLHGSPIRPEPVSFPAWARAQQDYVLRHLPKKPALSLIGCPPTDLSFWGLESRSNRRGDAVRTTVVLDGETSKQLLGDACNAPLRTEPVELFLAALLHAFHATFPERELPAVFNEGHGREVWDDGIDLSRTVGWFTTFCPVVVDHAENLSLVDTIMRTKDARRRMTENGRNWFSALFLPETKQSVEWPVELVFNYAGAYQQLERKDALFRAAGAGRATRRSGSPNSPRASLFSVFATLQEGRFRFEFEVNKHAKQQHRIAQWVYRFKQTLENISAQLAKHSAEPTLSDFPLLELDYDSLRRLKDTVIRGAGIQTWSNVEDVFPCSAMQCGLLMSQLRDKGTKYKTITWIEASDVSGGPVAFDRLMSSWKQVVNRHAILRTVFVESCQDDRAFDQVVLHQVEPRIVMVNCAAGADAQSLMASGDGADDVSFEGKGPPHHLTVYRTADDRVFCKLEKNHSITDGTSSTLMLRDWALAYSSKLTRTKAPRYRDYIAYCLRQDSQEAATYWEQRLKDATPCCYPTPAGRDADEIDVVMVPDVDADQVKTFCRRFEVTLFNVIQAAWALTLANYLRSDDICFGYLVSGRDLPVDGIEGLAGPLINMLVCRLQVQRPSTKTVLDLVKEAREQYFSSHGHQTYFLGDALHSMRLSGQRLFNTAINFAGTNTAKEPQDTGLRLRRLKHRDNTEFALTVTVRKSPTGGPALSLRYATAQIPHDQAMRIAATLSHCLSTLISHPQSTVTDLSNNSQLLSPHDQSLISAWTSFVPSPVSACIHRLFSQKAKEQPGAPAISAWDGSLTYSELDHQASQLAAHLVSLGARPGTFIPAIFPKSCWCLISTVAILKSGAAFVPLDTSTPHLRLRSILAQTSATLVIAHPDHAGLLSGLAVHVIAPSAALLAHIAPLQDIVAVEPHRPAYAIFTSGSTGAPKGVVISHCAIASSALAHTGPAQLCRTTRALQFAAHAFDASVLQTLSVLLVGGCVCVPSDEQRLLGLAAFVEAHGVNWMHLTPSFARTLDPAGFASVKTLVLGGEALSPSMVRAWAPFVDNAVGSYGPTECAVTCVLNPRTAETPDEAKVLGRPTQACRAWVVDPGNDASLVPVGAIGELLLEGPILGTGYLGDREKTDECFIVDPPWAHPEEHGHERRFYKTGDLVQYRGDGSLVFVDRKDTQVKLLGQRLELTEIEHHLNAAPGVRQGVVLLPRAGPCANKLVAIVTVDAAHSSAPEGLEYIINGALKVHAVPSRSVSAWTALIPEMLMLHLSDYMVPSTYLVLESFPRLVSLKADRKGLLAWLESMDDASFQQISKAMQAGDAVKPTNELESRLQRIWSHVLNIELDLIDANSSFRVLGGDSIAAMAIVAAARAAGLGVATQDVLQTRTIRQLAARIEKYQAAATAPAIALSATDEVGKLMVLSPIQQLHFLRAPDGDSSYLQSTLLRLTMRVTKEQMVEAVTAVVRAHSMLRARFCRDQSGTWQQMVTDDVYGSFRVVERRLASKEQIPAAVESIRNLVDFEQGPLTVVGLITVGDLRLASFAIHHLVMDLVSLRIILRELEQLLVERKPITAEPVSFLAWNAAQAEYAAAQLTPSTYLPPIPPLDREFWGFSPAANTPANTTSRRFFLDRRTSETLLGHAANAPLQTEPVELLLAGLFHSFGTAFDRRLPAIFAECHGREPWDEAIDLSCTVGWFTTFCPILPDDASASSSSSSSHFSGGGDEGHCLGEANDLVDAIQRTKDARRRVPRNGQPFFSAAFFSAEGRQRFLGEKAGSGGGASSHSWPVEVAFNYSGAYRQLERRDTLFAAWGGRPTNLTAPRLTAPSALFTVLVAPVRGERLCFDVVYNRRLRRQEGIARWVGEMRRTLRAMARVLPGVEGRHTLRDFPLLRTSYEGLRALKERLLPAAGVAAKNVQDMYPCSPMQQGMQLSQIRRGGTAYRMVQVFEARASAGGAVDVDRLCAAWQAVVDRHPVLRTVFVESCQQRSAGALYDQVVLKCFRANISVRECDGAPGTDDDDDDGQQELAFVGSGPPHRLTVYKCRSGGRVFVRLEKNHAITDAATMAIALADWAAAYAGTLEPGEGPPYAAFVAFLQRHNDATATLRYWKDTLAGLAPCLLSITTGPAPPVSPHAVRSVDVPAPRVADVRAFCRRTDATVFNVLQLAWALTLARYAAAASDDDDGSDVCFGYLVSGRDLPVAGASRMAGPMMNMLTCRADKRLWAGNVVEALAALREQTLRGIEHQTCSLGEVYHELGLKGEPLFNTALNFQAKAAPGSGAGGDGEAAAGLTFEHVWHRDDTEFDFMLFAAESESSLDISLRFATAHTAPGDAASIAQSLAQALAALVGAPQTRPVADLDLLSSQDTRLISQWTSQSLASVDSTLHALVSQKAGQAPSALAAEGWDGLLTYEQQEKLSARLALRLVHAGARSGAFVTLCFDKSIWTQVAMLAVLKAGAAFVALDPAAPPSRLREVLGRLRAQVAVSSTNRADVLHDMVPTIVVLDPASLMAADGEDGATALVQTAPDDAAYAVFTSGSTGRPKGIVVSHRAICSAATAFGRAFGITETTRSFQFAAYTFDVSVGDIFSTLLRGACVCVPSEHARTNALAAAVSTLRADALNLTSSVAALLEPEHVPAVHTLIAGGELLDAANVRKWAHRVRMVNIYGPAECAVWCAGNVGLAPASSPANIGHGIGARLWVASLSLPGQLAPVGAIGELLVEGPCVARGYLHEPDMTAKVFVDDPAWLLPHFPAAGDASNNTAGRPRRFYRTGDLVRYNATDGSLHFVARKDTQVKVNGQRVELREIEDAVKQAAAGATGDGVRFAIAVIPRHGALAGSLVAVVSGAEGRHGAADVNPKEDCGELVARVGKELTKALAPHKVPRILIPVDAMPMLTAGKLDRKSVTAWIEGIDARALSVVRRTLGHGALQPPTTPLEKQIQGIWAAVLRMPPDEMGVNAPFVTLGGDSMSAMAVVAKCRDAGLNLATEDILRSGTIAELAARAETPLSPLRVGSEKEGVRRLLNAPEPSLVEAFAQAGVPDLSLVEDVYPCSPMQQGIQVTQMAEPGPRYKSTVLFQVRPARVGEAASAEMLVQAWRQVVQRNSILRTVFLDHTDSNGLFLQAVLKALAPRVDAVRCADAAEVHSLFALKRSEPLAPTGAQHCLTVYTTTAGDVFFVLEQNHTITDKTSFMNLLRQWRHAYDGHSETHPIPDYASYIRYVQHRRKDELVGYFARTLAGIQPCRFPALPSSHATGPAASPSLPCLPSGKTTAHVPLLPRETIAAFSISSGFTLATIFQAAWALVLRSYVSPPGASSSSSSSSSSSDVCFGYLVSGRDAPLDGVQDLVGPLANMLIRRVHMKPATTPLALLDGVQEAFYRDNEHQSAPLAEVCRALGWAAPVMFNTAVNFLRSGRKGERGGGDGGVAFEAVQNYQDTGYSVAVSVIDRGDAVEALVSCAEAHCDKRAAANIAATLGEAVRRIVEAPERPLGEAAVVSLRDREQLLKWNTEVDTTPVERCVHEVVEEQVARQPGRPAVCAWDGSLTYAELDDQAARVAAHLRVEAGVGPEHRVLVCFSKCRLIVVALLAVLKAGAAAVLVESNFPAARLQRVARQAGARIALVSSSTAALDLGPQMAKQVVSDAWLAALPPPSPTLPPSTVRPYNAAYIVFTSGSTGHPKGAIIPHASFATSALAHARAMATTAASRVLHFASHAFDAALQELLTTLMVGGCVCIPSDADRLDNLAAYMREARVNWAVLTPSVASALAPAAVPALDTLVLAGESVTPAVLDAWARGSSVRLVQGYGPSECAVASHCLAPLTADHSPRCIGRPICGKAWVVDAADHTRLVPVGAVGELLLEGPAVGRGYLDEPRKTAEAFVRAPAWRREMTALEEQTLLYKTGDLVQMGADGMYYFLGRRDMQVKRRGQRLELGDVEAGILSSGSAGARSAMATVPGRGCFDGQLVAVVCFEGAESVGGDRAQARPVYIDDEAWGAAEDVATRLVEHLPSYMIPDVVLPARHLPLLPSGKLDRGKIAQWIEGLASDPRTDIGGTADGAPGPREPTTAMEQRLHRIWSEVLNLREKDIGVHDAFAGLGGDSISAMAVVARSRAGNLNVTTADILQCKTISQLAARADANATGTGASAASSSLGQPLPAVDLDGHFELSPIQQLHFELAPNGDNQNQQTFFLRLSRNVSLETLSQAMVAVIETHPMLRARFSRRSDETWQQHVSPDTAASFHLQEATLASPDRKAALATVLTATRGRIDFQRGPLVAASVIYYTEPNCPANLFFAIHHLAVDLVSWRIILRELEDVVTHSGPTVTSEPVSFLSYAAAQAAHARQHLNTALAGTPIDSTDLSYWGLPTAPLHPSTARKTFVLTKATSEKLLGSVCNTALDTEPIELLLSALLASFQDAFPDRHLPVVFNEGHGREVWDAAGGVDLSRTVGWFTTLCPIAVDTPLQGSGSRSGAVVELVRRVRHARRAWARNGWDWFSARMLSDGASEKSDGQPSGSWWPFELAFNFSGSYQQLERRGALFSSAERPKMEEPARKGARLAVFDAAVTVLDGALRASLDAPPQMLRDESVQAWIDLWEKRLYGLVAALETRPAAWLLDRDPLLADSPQWLEHFHASSLAPLGIAELSEVESIWPCAPVQEQILAAAARNPAFYTTTSVWHVEPAAGTSSVDPERFLSAWQRVRARHAVLRTVFIHLPGLQTGDYVQVVLKPSTLSPTAGLLSQPGDLFDDNNAITGFSASHLPLLRVAPSASDRRLLPVKLTISHAAIDALSRRTLLAHLIAEYSSAAQPPAAAAATAPLPRPPAAVAACPGPQFTDLIQQEHVLYQRPVGFGSARVAAADDDEAARFWAPRLAGLEPCLVPPCISSSDSHHQFSSSDSDPGAEQPSPSSSSSSGGLAAAATTAAATAASSMGALRHARHRFARLQHLQDACRARSTTVGAAVLAAWALTLRSVVPSSGDRPCFAHLVAGREADRHPRIAHIVGPVFNVLLCTVSLPPPPSLPADDGDDDDDDDADDDGLLWAAARAVYDDYAECVAHQASGLPAAAKKLFNSAVNFHNFASYGFGGGEDQDGGEREDGEEEVKKGEVRMKYVGGRDPMEYDVALCVNIEQETLRVRIDYWEGRVAAETVERAMKCFLDFLHRAL